MAEAAGSIVVVIIIHISTLMAALLWDCAIVAGRYGVGIEPGRDGTT